MLNVQECYILYLKSNPSTEHMKTSNLSDLQDLYQVCFFFPKSVVIKENPTRKSSLSHFNKLTYNCNKFIDFDRFTTWGTYIYNIEADEIYM